MLRRAVTIAFGLTLLASFTHASAESEPDWVLIKATAGTEGASYLELPVRIHASMTSGTQAIGFGFSVRTPGGVIQVHPGSDAPIDVHTTQAAGGLSFEVQPRKDYPSWEITGGGFSPQMAPGEMAVVLVFATGMTFESIQVGDPKTNSGSVTVGIERGSGSRIVSLAAISDDGIAVAAGGLVAGSTRHSAVTPTGIAGGFSEEGCHCSTSWIGPDGHSGDWSSDGRSGPTNLTFAGPGGPWEWSWEGIRQGTKEPVIGAYAPIGEDWTLFDNHLAGTNSSPSGR